MFALVGGLPFVNIVPTVSLVFKNTTTLALSVGMAVFNTVLPYILYTIGLKSVESSKAPIIATIEPVMATMLGAVIYDETITLNGIIGILLVIGSVAVLTVKTAHNHEHDFEL